MHEPDQKGPDHDPLRMSVIVVFGVVDFFTNMGMGVEMNNAVAMAVTMKMDAFAGHADKDIATENNQHDTDGKLQHMGKISGDDRFHHQGGGTESAQGQRMPGPPQQTNGNGFAERPRA